MVALRDDRCADCGLYIENCSCDAIYLSPSQLKFVNSDKRFVYLNGGRNTGKGWSACIKIVNDIQSGVILPGARILVLGPTYPQLKKSCLLTFDKIVGDEGLIVEKIDGNEPERRLVNGIIAYFRNASNPDQTRGHEVQIVWMDEAAQMEEETLALTNMTMRQFGDNARYQTLITTTPRGRNWLWRTFVNPETRKYDDDKVDYIHTTTLEAAQYGIVRQDYVEESIYKEGTDMFRQEILAEFVTWAGLVFNYDPTRHTPDPFVLPKFKTVVGGVDIGTVSPTAIVLIGLDQQNGLWVFKEYYQRRANMHEWMKLCGEWTREFKVSSWVVDSAADLEIKTMRAAGLPVRPSIKSKDAAGTAVNYINDKFAQNQLFISPDCPALRMELETYQYKEVMSGDEVTFLDKVKPNQPDHAADATRYSAMEIMRVDASAHRQRGWSPMSFGG